MNKLLLLILSYLLVVGTIMSSSAATAQTATPVPHPVEATPTIDRLAAPPTVVNPGQADEGAQLYWLHCQPCHGDQGQGLTDEWRAQYPPEDQNCWNSGCHGDRPYESGFTLPTAVPPVAGDDSLRQFGTAGQLYIYIQSVMPYQDPGNLTEEEYLAVTAFLLRQHGVVLERTLDSATAAEIPLPAASVATETAVEPTTDSGPNQDSANNLTWAVGIALFILFFFWLIRIWWGKWNIW